MGVTSLDVSATVGVGVSGDCGGVSLVWRRGGDVRLWSFAGGLCVGGVKSVTGEALRMASSTNFSLSLRRSGGGAGWSC